MNKKIKRPCWSQWRTCPSRARGKYWARLTWGLSWTRATRTIDWRWARPHAKNTDSGCELRSLDAAQARTFVASLPCSFFCYSPFDWAHLRPAFESAHTLLVDSTKFKTKNRNMSVFFRYAKGIKTNDAFIYYYFMFTWAFLIELAIENSISFI